MLMLWMVLILLVNNAIDVVGVVDVVFESLLHSA